MSEIENLSDEALEIAKGMIAFCLAHGYRTGMDEGFDKNERPHLWRRELEIFSDFNENESN